MRNIEPDHHLDEARHAYRTAFVEGGTSIERQLALIQMHTSFAIAGFLQQMAICGHGTRGFCPWCHAAGGPQ